jgi:hypothetical protein
MAFNIFKKKLDGRELAIIIASDALEKAGGSEWNEIVRHYSMYLPNVENALSRRARAEYASALIYASVSVLLDIVPKTTILQIESEIVSFVSKFEKNSEIESELGGEFCLSSGLEAIFKLFHMRPRDDGSLFLLQGASARYRIALLGATYENHGGLEAYLSTMTFNEMVKHAVSFKNSIKGRFIEFES